VSVVYESNPLFLGIFNQLVEMVMFMAIYSVPLVFGVIVLAMLTNEWLEERGDSNE
jgi:hypothetical protein